MAALSTARSVCSRVSRTTASGNVATFLNALSTNLVNSLSSYAYSIPKANVQVQRDSDGGLVYPK